MPEASKAGEVQESVVLGPEREEASPEAATPKDRDPDVAFHVGSEPSARDPAQSPSEPADVHAPTERPVLPADVHATAQLPALPFGDLPEDFSKRPAWFWPAVVVPGVVIIVALFWIFFGGKGTSSQGDENSQGDEKPGAKITARRDAGGAVADRGSGSRDASPVEATPSGGSHDASSSKAETSKATGAPLSGAVVPGKGISRKATHRKKRTYRKRAHRKKRTYRKRAHRKKRTYRKRSRRKKRTYRRRSHRKKRMYRKRSHRKRTRKSRETINPFAE